MGRVNEVFAECRSAFIDAFDRDPGDTIETIGTDDAEVVLIVSSSIAIEIPK